MPAVRRWSDDRLDDLNRRLTNLNGIVTEVAVLKSELSGLSRELRANTNATHEVSEQFEKVQLEPFQRARDLRDRVLLGLFSAVAGGAVALLVAFLSH